MSTHAGPHSLLTSILGFHPLTHILLLKCSSLLKKKSKIYLIPFCSFSLKTCSYDGRQRTNFGDVEASFSKSIPTFGEDVTLLPKPRPNGPAASKAIGPGSYSYGTTGDHD